MNELAIKTVRENLMLKAATCKREMKRLTKTNDKIQQVELYKDMNKIYKDLVVQLDVFSQTK